MDQYTQGCYGFYDQAFSDAAALSCAACTGAMGDYVWVDSNGNGIQDEVGTGVAGVKVTLSGASSSSTVTDGTGHSAFSNLCAGNYTVTVDGATLPAGLSATTSNAPGSNTGNDSNGSPASVILPANNSTGYTIDFGYKSACTAAPNTCLQLTKSASTGSANPLKPVTYTYVVKNTSGGSITGVNVVDDNGTPNYPADDFTVASNLTIAANSSITVTATVTPPAQQCVTVNGVGVFMGTLIAQILGSGDVKVTYLQSQAINDNTYGTGASAGWKKGHKFSDLVNSDLCEFAFYNGAGTKVLDANIDYITASGNFPSGYGSLGPNGGDGKLISGTKANILSWDTTLSHTLNLPPFQVGYTVNSPPPPNASWDYTDGYMVTVAKAAFGATGFGNVVIPLCHNSPPKSGNGAVSPTPCDYNSTNTASASGQSGGVTVTASANATVQILGKIKY